MAKETEAILRTILYQAMIAENKADIETAIKAMCTKDDIAAVKEMVAEYKQRRNL
ncbi:MAG: hypothetical protein FWE02_01990 [Defluviitaleaceae bacterium]|nr:hypothetical protein [Defluviitaleaceae bacterium]